MKNEFKKIVQDNIRRPGIEDLMAWLETTDFYFAPCSAKFHLACVSGLLSHSMNVYNNLRLLNEALGTYYSDETIAIVSLFHDLCKVNYYQITNGKISVNDQFPMQHGPKSVFLIQRFMNLTEEEACAISYHMGAYNEPANSYNLSNAMGKYKLVTLLQMADLSATFITEV